MPSRTRRTTLWSDRRVGPAENHWIYPDRSHPLRPDRAWLPRLEGPLGTVAVQQIPELVKGYAYATITSAASRGAGVSPRFGRGIEFQNTGAGPAGIDCGDETDLLPTAAAITVVVAKRRTSASLTTGAAFGVVDNGVDFTVRCTAFAPFTDGVCYWDYGGVTGGTSRLSIGGLTYGDDIFAFTVGSRGMEIWQNGIKVASNGGGVTRNDSGGNFFIGSGGRAVDVAVDHCVIPLLYVYYRQLQESQIVDVSFDPFQWLYPWRVRRPYRFVPGIAVNATLDAVLLAATSVSGRQGYGTRFCRLHRIFFVDDDRFPMPCAKWGGHEPRGTGG